MTRRINFARRKARGGKKLLPGNPRQWENEHNGLDLREDLNLPLGEPLPHEAAFETFPDVTILPHGAVPVASVYIDYFRNEGSSCWSGLVLPLPEGGALVLYNDHHPMNRIRATLMEEFFHLRLGHPATTVRLYKEQGGRTYDSTVEAEAYGSGAAALVPYGALRQMLESGDSLHSVALRFQVSQELIEYRLKVTRLYRRFRKR